MDLLSTMSVPTVSNDPWSPQSPDDVGASTATLGFDMPDFDPLESEKYLESLETRLNRIKGKTKEPTAKDMLKSLGQMKDGQLKVLIDDSDTPYVSTHEPEEMLPQEHPALAALQRKIQPQKQALTVGELKRLVENDDLEKLAQTILTDTDGAAAQETSGSTDATRPDSDKDIDESAQGNSNNSSQPL